MPNDAMPGSDDAPDCTRPPEWAPQRAKALLEILQYQEHEGAEAQLRAFLEEGRVTLADLGLPSEAALEEIIQQGKIRSWPDLLQKKVQAVALAQADLLTFLETHPAAEFSLPPQVAKQLEALEEDTTYLATALNERRKDGTS